MRFLRWVALVMVLPLVGSLSPVALAAASEEPLALTRGLWTSAASPLFDDPGRTVMLPDGRVLLLHESGKLEVFDPKGGPPGPGGDPLGSWSALAAAERAPSGKAFLIKGSLPQCGVNCGKVLVEFQSGCRYRNPTDTSCASPPVGVQQVERHVTIRWGLYDPATDSWGDVMGASAFSRAGGKGAGFEMISGTDCGLNCGKLLVTAPGIGIEPQRDWYKSGLPSLYQNQVELYDPVTSRWRLTAPMLAPRAGMSTVVLPDARVLVVGGAPVDTGRASRGAASVAAELFDPRTESWRLASPPVSEFVNSAPLLTLLADGRVLAHGSEGSQIYDPQADSWEVVPNCPCIPRSSATLANGAVLAFDGPHTWLFDVGEKAWDAATRASVSPSQEPLLLTGGPGACGGNCGKVLVVNDGSAELYWPPDLVDPSEFDRPLVAAVDPSEGSTSGGQTVTISGSGFMIGSEVTFGGVPAADVAVHSSTSLTAVAPPHPQGTVDVLVTTPIGSSVLGPAGRFTYVAATVTSVSPSSGPTAGGTTVTVTGRGIMQGSDVTFGEVPGAEVVVQSDGSITAVTPEQPPGTVDVVVTGPDGTSSVARDAFTYVAIPKVGSVDPAGGPTAGGSEVTITGTGLTGVTDVAFGKKKLASESFEVLSDKAIVAITPAHPQGEVDVVVANLNGSSSLTPGARFTYGSGAWQNVVGLEQCPPDVCTDVMRRSATVLDGPRCRSANPPDYCGTVLVVGGLGQASEQTTKGVAGTGDVRDLLLPSREEQPEIVRRVADSTAVGGKTLIDMLRELFPVPRPVPPSGARLFDPAAQGGASWRPVAPPSLSRGSHTATLLDGPECHRDPPLPSQLSYCGQVLVVGGGSTEEMLKVQEGFGDSAQATTTVAELYDPATDTWTSAGSTLNRIGHTSTLLGGSECASGPVLTHCGRVLVAGGTLRAAKEHALPVTEIFDPLTGIWIPGPRLDACEPSSPSCSARFFHAAASLPSGEVLVAGGLGPSLEYGGEPEGPLDPIDGEQADIDQEHLPLPTFEDESCQINGSVGYEVIVEHCKRYSLNSSQIYDPVAGAGRGAWRPAEAMAIRRSHFTATPLKDGRVLVAGGTRQGGQVGHTEIFDPASGHWDAAAVEPMQTERIGHTATLLDDGNVLVTGGVTDVWRQTSDEASFSGEATPAAEIYDVRARQWRNTSFMTTPRWSHIAAVVDPPSCQAQQVANHCDAVLIAGGEEGPDTAELYIPAPVIDEVTPDRGPLEGGSVVTIKGFYLGNVSSMGFGDRTVGREHLQVNAAGTELTVTAPPAASSGTIQVAAVNAGGTSAQDPAPRAARFSYVGVPDAISDLTAESLSDDSVKLSFSAAGFPNTDDDLVVTDYVIKQSRSPITPTNFGGAASLCGGVCHFEPSDPAVPLKVDSPLTQEVQGLSPGTTYYYAVQAKSGESHGPISDSVSVTTGGQGVKQASGVLGRVNDLSVTARSARELELSFAAADGGDAGGAARYVIKQSTEPLSDSNFDSATSLCGGVCSFPVTEEGDKVSLTVKDLNASTTYHYAVKALGEGDEQGPMSDVVSAQTLADTIAPDAVTDLSAAPLSGAEISLTFAAPASDAGEGPPVTDYVIKQAREPITDATFEDAKTLCEETCEFTPAAAGEQLSLSVTGLESSTTYHYALKAIDEGANTSALSNSAFATTSKVTPGKVTGLKAAPKSMSKITLSFPAADDGTGEAATSYVIKQAKRPIRSEDDFSKAQALCGDVCRFRATEIGHALRLTVTGLNPATTYHYAVRALDDSGDNLGARSTSTRATTRPDRIVPGKVDDLRARALSKTAVKLRFSAVASNKDKGPAVATYIIKQSTRPIRNNRDFNKAQSLCGKLCTFDAGKRGAPLSLKITDLRPATTYYYAIKAVDAGSNRGARSKTTRTRTSVR